jgi:hypothetical protein
MMSKLLRYAAAGVAMASLGIASGAQAATTDSADVKAEILDALSVDVDATNHTLDFGQIADGGISADQTITVSPAGARGACPTNLVCQGTTAAPLFHVSSGVGSKTVLISFVNPTETLSYVGTPPLGFTSAMSVGNFVTDANYNSVTNQVMLDASGNADFHVGGTLTIHPNMAPGVYTGSVTVSVAYN